MSDRESFLRTVEAAVAAFPDNRFCRLVDAGDATMHSYHAILRMIFHQTFHGPSTFALASAFCAPRHHAARDYLIHHADEEKAHWRWVIGDLERTGYDGPDPRTAFPEPACQAYVAFNFYTAQRFPLGRLAIAAVLESIGATYGKDYSTRLCKALKLTRDQVVFFYGHGDTDVGHTAEVLEVIDGCELTPEEWAQMGHYARVAGHLYRAMYEEALS